MEAHEEAQELQEHAEHAQHDRSMAPVSLTMAIMAVLVAAAALLGHRAHTEEIILQTKATDQWAYYQAKNIRRQNAEMFRDLLAMASTKDSEAAAKIREKYQAVVEKEADSQKDIQKEARGFEREQDGQRRRANRFDLGEVLLEVALVITSITLLTLRKLWWQAGLVLGAAGVIVTATGFAIH